MTATTTLELKIPLRSPTTPPGQLQRTVVRHLLLDGQITMSDALAVLAADDQTWLVEKLISDAEESLELAAMITDDALRHRYWRQYGELLGHLLHWHEHWSTFHSEMVSLLRLVVRRYAGQELNPKRVKLLKRLTSRLHDDFLYREELFAAEQALQAVGWDTVLDLSPIADQLIPSYLEELGRA